MRPARRTPPYHRARNLVAHSDAGEPWAAMSNQPGTLRLAVIDTDSAFLTVLGKRLEAAGWEQRVLAGEAPSEELIAMKLNALLIDTEVLGARSWGFLEEICGAVPGLAVLVCAARSTVAQRVRG